MLSCSLLPSRPAGWATITSSSRSCCLLLLLLYLWCCWSPTPSPPPPPLPTLPPPATRSPAAAQTSRSSFGENEGNRAHPGRPVWQPDRSQGESPKQPWIGFKKLYFSPQSLVSKLQVVCVENRWICRLERPAHGWIGRGPRGSRPFSKI